MPRCQRGSPRIESAGIAAILPNASSGRFAPAWAMQASRTARKPAQRRCSASSSEFTADAGRGAPVPADRVVGPSPDSNHFDEGFLSRADRRHQNARSSRVRTRLDGFHQVAVLGKSAPDPAPASCNSSLHHFGTRQQIPPEAEDGGRTHAIHLPRIQETKVLDSKVALSKPSEDIRVAMISPDRLGGRAGRLGPIQGGLRITEEAGAPRSPHQIRSAERQDSIHFCTIDRNARLDAGLIDSNSAQGSRLHRRRSPLRG